MGEQPAGPVDRIRGVMTGLLTAALAVAAHGAGGGVLPNGAATVSLAVLAGTAGALATNTSCASSLRYLMGLLAAGQVLGHLLLSVAGHHHAGSAAPAASMLAAHLLAIAAGATLIGAGERLWHALSRAVHAVVRVACIVGARPVAIRRRADQPLRSALLMAASMSHRGPPVSLGR
jgi:hypothetical protein